MLAVALGGALVLTGCGDASLRIDPPSGLTVPSPVAVTVRSDADIDPTSVVATLDGADVSSRFTIGLRTLSADLPMADGSHTLEVHVGIWNALSQQYGPATARTSFTSAPGGDITLALSPAALAITPGTSAALRLGVTRIGAFGGDVDVAVAGTGPGVTGATTRIPSTTTSGVLTIPVAPGAFARDDVARVDASGSLYDARVGESRTFLLRIAHPPGPFATPSWGPPRLYGTTPAPDGVTTLEVGNGAAAAYEVRFLRGSIQLGIVEPLNPGLAAGAHSFGTGFCPGVGHAVGFVVSGTGPGVPGGSDYAVTVRPVEFDVHQRPRLDLAARATPGGPTTEPTVLFSPDCGVVVAIGANSQTGSGRLAQVFDVMQGRTLCEVPVGDPGGTAVTVDMQPPGTSNQTIAIADGGVTKACPVF